MWKTLNLDKLPDGSVIELRFGEFGKGRAKVRAWKMFRAGEQVGYASTPEDAEVNWRRVRAGMVRDDTTGEWVYRHNATDGSACTECGHFGNGQVPGCTCFGCDDGLPASSIPQTYLTGR